MPNELLNISTCGLNSALGYTYVMLTRRSSKYTRADRWRLHITHIHGTSTISQFTCRYK